MVGGQDLGIIVSWQAPNSKEVHMASAGMTSNGDLLTAKHTFSTQPSSKISLADTSGKTSQTDSFSNKAEASQSTFNSANSNNTQQKVKLQVVDKSGKVIEENTGTATFNGNPNLTDNKGVLLDAARIKPDKPFETKIEKFDLVKPGEKFEDIDKNSIKVENPNPNGKPIGDQKLEFQGISEEGIMQFKNPNGVIDKGASGAPITAEINGTRKIIGYISVGNDGTVHSPFLGAAKPSQELGSIGLAA